MKISKKDLERAVSQGVLSSEQAEQLWNSLEANHAVQPHFCPAQVAYYFGAMIVISAMGWFMTLAWENLGGPGIFVVASIYAVCFSLAGRTLWQQKSFQIPGGLLFTIAVCMTPLAIYGVTATNGLSDIAVLRSFCKQRGLDLSPPSGVFYTYAEKSLAVRSTWENLEAFDKLLAEIPQAK